MSAFNDADAVANYVDGPPRLVPGYAALQRMTQLLAAERAPADARVLVLGAGGGLELKVFAEAEPGWRFVGVDPSAKMLGLARDVLGPLAERADLVEGLIGTAPEGPFDAATALLTLHFLSIEERARTLAEMRRRLKPGAPLVVAHFSMPNQPEARDRWFGRYAAFARSSGVPAEQADKARVAIGAQLPILSPEQDEQMLRDAGFSGVELFYAAFTFRGWVGYA
ncbi:MAG: methyltransferase domain-containing protein [Alphaproteobacteria bacterium]|nr:methyltransferase domain-containing protein [Alphaproteobacteria bacterium]